VRGFLRLLDHDKQILRNLFFYAPCPIDPEVIDANDNQIFDELKLDLIDIFVLDCVLEIFRALGVNKLFIKVVSENFAHGVEPFSDEDMNDVLKGLAGQYVVNTGKFWSHVVGLVFLINSDEALVENDSEEGELFLFWVVRIGHIKIHQHPDNNEHFWRVTSSFLFVHLIYPLPHRLIKAQILFIIARLYFFKQSYDNNLSILPIAPVLNNLLKEIKILDPSIVVNLMTQYLQVQNILGLVVHITHPVVDLLIR
jgi:hypothetical protein